jgi:hypothetical protein
MANKKLKKYALVSEIISAAAVIVSLVFVAFQVKDNTAAIRSSTYDGILSDHIEWRLTIATHPELGAAMLKLENPDTGMNDLDRKNAERAMEALWQIYERAYFARKYETLGDSEWARYEEPICRFASYIDDVEALLGRYLTTEFVGFVKSCNQSDDR